MSSQSSDEEGVGLEGGFAINKENHHFDNKDDSDVDETDVGSAVELQHSWNQMRQARTVRILTGLAIFLCLALAATTTLAIRLGTQGGTIKGGGLDKDMFDSFADKVIDSFVDIADERMTSAGSLVLAMVAHGVDHIRKWPFVALSSFQQRSSTVKRLSGAISVAMHPIVWEDDRATWENYTQYDAEDIKWYQQGRQYQQELGIDSLDQQSQVVTEDPNLDLSDGLASHIYSLIKDGNGEEEAVIAPQKRYYLPIWQTSPVSSKRTIVNQDYSAKSQGITSCLDRDAVVFEGMEYSKPGSVNSSDPITAKIAWLLTLVNGKDTKYDGDIFTTVFFPLYDNFNIDRATVGVMSIVIHWARYFRGILPQKIRGIVFVLDNGCDEPFTYQINGEQVVPLGHGDLHDPKYEAYKREASFREIDTIPDGTKFGMMLYQGRCPYSIRVYPSDDFE